MLLLKGKIEAKVSLFPLFLMESCWQEESIKHGIEKGFVKLELEFSPQCDVLKAHTQHGTPSESLSELGFEFSLPTYTESMKGLMVCKGGDYRSRTYIG